MKRSMGLTPSTPMAVITAQKMKVMAMVVSTERWSLSMSRAPKYWPMMTQAPMEKPLKKNTSMFTIMVVDPTAASASLPTKFPTTMESTVLYSI